MAILTEDMQRVVREQKLGFWATVSDDGSPNLSPKGTTNVFDADRLYFCNVCSPQTVANVRRGSGVEVNVVDPFVRKGYRFKGTAVVLDRGTDEFANGLARAVDNGLGLADRVDAIVVLRVREVLPLTSPAYDDGTVTEAELIAANQARFAQLHPSPE